MILSDPYSQLSDTHKTRMIGLLYGEEIVTMCKLLWNNTGTWRTDGWMDRRRDRIPISNRVSALLCWSVIKICTFYKDSKHYYAAIIANKHLLPKTPRQCGDVNDK